MTDKEMCLNCGNYSDGYCDIINEFVDEQNDNCLSFISFYKKIKKLKGKKDDR